jgi:hypothetical protein
MRVVIAGAPRTGKTTLADEITRSARHTDDLVPTHGWSGSSYEAAQWFDAAGPWVVEGVAVPRALRKWFLGHPEGRPCDLAVYVAHPCVPVTPGQMTMARGCWTVWVQVLGELERRGVEVQTVQTADDARAVLRLAAGARA